MSFQRHPSDASRVILDSGHHVRVQITSAVQAHTGCLHIDGLATLLHADGVPVTHADGNPVTSAFGHTLSAIDSVDAAAVNAHVKAVAHVLLGEHPELPLWAHEIHAEAHAQASIRQRIASVDNSGDHPMSTWMGDLNG